MVAPGPAPNDRFRTAATAEGHYRRMWRMRQMSPGELAALLAAAPEEAAPWIESAARYGVVQAQLRLGQMRLDGVGVSRDHALALRWFKRAAQTSSAEAINMVGRCLENGWGAPVDLQAAAQWYRRAAEAGYDWGQYNYANMLFDGRGVDCDKRQAVAGYRQAADQGHARAMNLLARCYEEGWGLARDPVQAGHWYRRSAQAGYFRAQFNLGTILVGLGQIEPALDWFDKACRAATPDSLPGMVAALIRQGHPKVAQFGRDIGAVLFGLDDRRAPGAKA